jgi:hypothetical protein
MVSSRSTRGNPARLTAALVVLLVILSSGLFANAQETDLIRGGFKR